MTKPIWWIPIEAGGYPTREPAQFLVRMVMDGEPTGIWSEAWIERGQIVTKWSHSNLASKMRITHWMPGPDVEVAP